MLLSACGWRLQGALGFPPDLSSVSVSGGQEQTRARLDRALERAGLTLRTPGSGMEPDLVLMLHDDLTGERMVSVTAGGRPNEFEVYRVIEFSLAREGELLLDHRRIELTADYTHSVIDVLARQEEARQLGESLDDRVRQQLLREMEQAAQR
jgi:outer membrane lipopolysaccharide assembly protein LptE/RlpB